jgi:hypothetical protein
MIDHTTIQLALRNKLLTISGSLPAAAQRAWENTKFDPTAGTAYITEQYLPGPMQQVTLGALGELEVLPMYVIGIHAPTDQDILPAGNYADAILQLFAPGTAITAGSDTLYVRRDVAPYRSQLVPNAAAPGFAVTTVTIPLRLRTANTI